MMHFTLKERLALIKIHFELTDKDIARMLGISTRTLWNVVNNSGYYSPAHREHLVLLLQHYELNW